MISSYGIYAAREGCQFGREPLQSAEQILLANSLRTTFQVHAPIFYPPRHTLGSVLMEVHSLVQLQPSCQLSGLGKN